MKLINFIAMKNILLVAIVITFITGCEEDFIIQPKGSVSKSTLLNEEGMELLVVGAYASLHGHTGPGSGFSDWIQGSLYGGDANKGSDPGDSQYIDEFPEYRVLTNNRVPLYKWEFCYWGIKTCNQALNVINELTNVDVNLKARRRGELLTIRSMFYFELRKHYKNVPYIDEEIEAAQNNPKVQNNVEILPNIISSLNEAIDLLPETQTNVGRFNKWAAKGLLAKVYMFQHEYALAETLLKDIIDNGVTSTGEKYALRANYGDNFDVSSQNNSESIMEVQHSTDDLGNNANISLAYASLYRSGMGGGGYGFFQPNTTLVQSFVVDANGLPLLDGSYMDQIIPNSEIGGETQTNDADRSIPVDPRLDHSVMRRGIPFKDWGYPKAEWVRNISNGGNFMPKKHLAKQSDSRVPRGSGMNHIHIRFSEILLWYAEALAETGKHEDARAYVNMVRERAANPESMIMAEGRPAANYKVGLYPESYFDTKEKALEAIRFENKLETAMEGRRFFDLQRWGYEVAKAEIEWLLSQEVKFLPKYENARDFTEHMMYFPIPETQILIAGDCGGAPCLVQNEGY